MTTHTTTLITGAGRRIGASIARHLAAQGHSLVLHYHRSKAEAEALAVELRALSTKPTITLVAADLQKPDTLSDFWNGLPPVTTIIHNASRYTRDTLDRFDSAELRAHMAVNFVSPLILSQGFMHQLSKDAQGNIIVLGDDALGWSASPEFFTYTISKHSWRAAIDVLAAAVAPRARANLLALAPTLPGINDPEGMFERLAKHSPLARTGEVAEVLAAIDYLIASPGLTGQTIGLGNGMALATSRP